MITQEEAQSAIALLTSYIAQCREHISKGVDTIRDARRFMSPREGLTIESMDLSVRAYNSLKDYYSAHRGGRTLLNTSKKELLLVFGCGKKTVREIEAEFYNYGITLL